jgi:hypothetical protein
MKLPDFFGRLVSEWGVGGGFHLRVREVDSLMFSKGRLACDVESDWWQLVEFLQKVELSLSAFAKGASDWLAWQKQAGGSRENLQVCLLTSTIERILFPFARGAGMRSRRAQITAMPFLH